MSDNVVQFRTTAELARERIADEVAAKVAEDVCRKYGQTPEGQVKLIKIMLDEAVTLLGGTVATGAIVEGAYQWLREHEVTNVRWLAMTGAVATRERPL